MVFKIKEVLSVRDYSDKVSLMHILKPKEEEVNIVLGELNELWGSQSSAILKDELIDSFFDQNGYFNLEHSAESNCAVYLELESGYIIEDLDLLDKGIRTNIFISGFSNSKSNRIIYAFFLQKNQYLNVQGKKVKDQIVSSCIIANPNDLRLRGMLLNRSQSGYDISFDQEELLTANQFAFYLKMNLRTFQNKLSKGEVIAGKLIGGSKRWRFKDIQKWIDSLPKV